VSASSPETRGVVVSRAAGGKRDEQRYRARASNPSHRFRCELGMNSFGNTDAMSMNAITSPLITRPIQAPKDDQSIAAHVEPARRAHARR
jgi:hypothetical protein